MTGSQPCTAAAGWAGLVLAAASLYAAFTFEIEGVHHRDVVPLWRRGTAARAMRGDATTDTEALTLELGVRPQQ